MEKDLERYWGYFAVIAGLFFILYFNLYQPLLVIFAGVLLAIFLSTIIAKLVKWLGIKRKWSFAIVIVVLLILFTVFWYFFISSLSVQINQMIEKLPELFNQAKNYLSGSGWFSDMINRLSPESSSLTSGNVISGIRNVGSVLLSSIGGLIVILFLGLYMALNPKGYINGVIKYSPFKLKEKDLLETGQMLRSWLFGRILSMLVVGVLTYVSLIFLEVPLAFGLSVITAFLTFIPNFGPIFSALLLAFFALEKGLITSLYVIIVMVGIQTVESYFITPYIEKKVVSLLPGALFAGQLILGVLFGILGLILAAPLMVLGRSFWKIRNE